MESIPEEVVGAAGTTSGEPPVNVTMAVSNFVQDMAEKVMSMTETLRQRNTAEIKYQMTALSEECEEIAAGAVASASYPRKDTNKQPKQSQQTKYKKKVEMENLKNIMKSERARRADQCFGVGAGGGSGEMQKLIENNQPLDGKKMSTGFELVGDDLGFGRRQNQTSGEGEATTSDSGNGDGDDEAAEKPPSDIWDLLDENDRMLDDLINRSNPDPGNRAAIVAPTPERAFLEGGAVLQNIDFGFGLSPFAFPFETEPQISMDPNGRVDN